MPINAFHVLDTCPKLVKRYDKKYLWDWRQPSTLFALEEPLGRVDLYILTVPAQTMMQLNVKI